ncbi:unnamed protein product [Acanthoscelides obtectus]|uniref:Uncharacterized protein n=1 Tax=Acanthoscelides obtectus TaxID=200917 RepID=A0A9P0MHZ6_ACAOB|nr:unnamed protein product [Acanthoscelides obtectus]CAK1672540.1 hypothetical protein AOBTE_LOCUS28952 [Acanthoscelides obtectus]
MLDDVQRRAVRLIDDSSLTDSLETLSHRRSVGYLALFYRYTNGLCSSALSSMMPPHDVPARQTRLSLAAHPNRCELPELADATAPLSRGCRDCGTIYKRKLFPVLLTSGSSKIGLTKFLWDLHSNRGVPAFRLLLR